MLKLYSIPKVDELIKLFEELGFEKRHVKTGLNDEGITNVRMRDADGFHVDISAVERIPQDMTSIRMNVDSFEEPRNFLPQRALRTFREIKWENRRPQRVRVLYRPQVSV